MAFNSSDEVTTGKGLGQVVLGPDNSPPRLIENTVFARQHNDRYIAISRIIFYQRAGLVAVQTRHTDISKNQIRIVSQSTTMIFTEG